MDNTPFRPIGPASTGPVTPTPSRAPRPGQAPAGGPTFSSELAQFIQEASPQEGPTSTAGVQASDQRLHALRSDLDQVRLRVQQLQAFQAQAVQLYQKQSGN